MSVFVRVVCIVSAVLLAGCGGSSGGSSNPPPSSSNSSSSSSPSSSSSISSFSSSLAAIPDEILPEYFPSGTVEQLPMLTITTVNGAPVIEKKTYLNGTYSLTGEGLSPVEGTLEVRGRGNSTWDWPKKPYRLKLTTSTELLGMPKSRHWVLLANYADKTLMRNDVAFMFSESIGMAYTTRARHVELTFNGVYQGAYQLVEHIRVDDDRVAIDEMEVTDVDDESITGGYLMEIDFRMNRQFCTNPDNSYAQFCQNGVNMDRLQTFCVDSNHGMEPFCLDTPEDLLESEWHAQRAYIEQYISDTETALFSSNFADPDIGYAAYIDVESAVNYYIINELFKNADGAVASAWLYKPRGEKLHFGPIWDFDLALGNPGYGDLDKVDGWHIRQAPWFARLFADPAFEARVKARWQELKEEGRLELIFHYIDAREQWLDHAQQRNFERWPIFFWQEWYTRVIMGSYEAEVREMVRWQRARMEWMDAQLSQ